VDLEKIVVTPSRMEQYDYQAGSNVSTIDSEDIKTSGARYVQDILKEELGINVYTNSTHKTAKVDLRGFADTSISNVLVLIDGRKVNSIDLSGTDWLQIPVESIEKIEVLRGAGSVLYGDNAVGGVINIITKKGAKDLEGYAGVSLGSYNTEKEDVEIKGSAGDLSYYLYSKYYNTNGYRDNSDLSTKDFNTRLNGEITDSLALDLSVSWHEDDYGMPGGLNAAELAQYGRRGSEPGSNSDFASTKDRFVKLTVDSKPRFNGTDIGDITIDLFHRNRDAYSWFYYSGWPTATKYMIDTNGVTVKDVYKGMLSGRDLSTVIGLDYYDVDHVIKGTEGNTDDLSIYKKEIGFYAHADYEAADRLFFNTGARYQKAKYTFDQKAASVKHETREPSESVFMGGARYEYAEGSNMHMSVQESFRFLATDEWYSTWTGLDTDLKQQTGMQYEIGIKHNFDNIALLTVTPYWIDIKNEIYVNPEVYPGYNENYDRTRRKGVEIGTDIDLLKFVSAPYFDDLRFNTNCTYQQSEFKDGAYNGKDIPMVPRYLASARVKAGFLNGYNISLAGRYVGDRYAINDTNNETPKVKDNIIFDTRLSCEKRVFEFYAAISNIFDKKYFEYVVKPTGASDNKDYYPAPGRNLELGMKYKF
jgi:iron complex outermembrane recepter protein